MIVLLKPAPKRGDTWTCKCGTVNEPFRSSCINPKCGR